ncbi:SdpI family protein [Pseudonocardia broussonetiae]|uniref:SdpI family protein n=1 Tax=Pseudonocardia broussonetiae TaxID=2736640 RepID=A0A6M6JTU0_9PSEU|nr:SdpI family protein [Pseudonocardia broussonetiae]
MPRLVLAALFVTAGLVLLVVAVLGARERLPRNRWAGVRTVETLASDAAFALANRVAAAPLGAAGAVAVVGGAVLAAGPVGAVSVVVLVVTGLGALVLAVFGGMVGQRAAAAVPVPAAAPACAGTCAGCDLVAGCRPADTSPADTSPAATSPTSPDRP